MKNMQYEVEKLYVPEICLRKGTNLHQNSPDSGGGEGVWKS